MITMSFSHNFFYGLVVMVRCQYDYLPKLNSYGHHLFAIMLAFCLNVISSNPSFASFDYTQQFSYYPGISNQYFLLLFLLASLRFVSLFFLSCMLSSVHTCLSSSTMTLMLPLLSYYHLVFASIILLGSTLP